VEEALRRVSEAGENEAGARAGQQREYFAGLADLVDLDFLAGDEMWR
jgi:hypothetical protein